MGHLSCRDIRWDIGVHHEDIFNCTSQAYPWGAGDDRVTVLMSCGTDLTPISEPGAACTG